MRGERHGLMGLCRLALLVVLAAAALPACGRAERGPAAGAPSPRRVITMAPNLTEIVFALGAGDRLVAVSDFSDFPAAAQALPHLGGFVNPDIEQVLAHKPDLVILRDYSRSLEQKLAAFRVPVLEVRDEAIADIARTMREVGRALGLAPRGEALAAALERELDSYRRSPEPHHRPRVLLVAGRTPGTLQNLYAPGAGSFLDEMIRLAGGANLFADSKVPYLRVSKEEIIARDPEVIVEPVSASSYGGKKPAAADWRALGTVAAVRSGRVYALEGDYMLIPGPRLGLALRDLARVVRTGAGPAPSAAASEGPPRRRTLP